MNHAFSTLSKIYGEDDDIVGLLEVSITTGRGRILLPEYGVEMFVPFVTHPNDLEAWYDALDIPEDAKPLHALPERQPVRYEIAPFEKMFHGISITGNIDPQHIICDHCVGCHS